MAPMNRIWSGVGVSPHFFRQHKLEKNAGLTPTPAVIDRIVFTLFSTWANRHAAMLWPGRTENRTTGNPILTLSVPLLFNCIDSAKLAAHPTDSGHPVRVWP